MSGMPGRSGGWNRISVEDHLARGTYRKDRHGHLQEPPTDTYSDVDRDRLVAGLPAAAERLGLALLESFSGWDPASLVTLRAYVLSCERLAALESASGNDARAMHKELRSNLLLLKMLDLRRDK